MSVQIESWRQGDSWRFLREEQHNKSKEHGFGQHRGRNPDYDSMCWSFGVCLPWTSSDLRKAKNKQNIDMHYSILEIIQKYLGANFFFFLTYLPRWVIFLVQGTQSTSHPCLILLTYLNCYVLSQIRGRPHKEGQWVVQGHSNESVAGQASWLRSATLPRAHAKGTLN